MTPDQLFADFEAGFAARKFSAGLLVAFIDFLTRLGMPNARVRTFNKLLSRFPRQTTTAAGKHANTLIVDAGDDTTVSLRPFYNAIEAYFRAENHRFDYPSCAPHATQAWGDYLPWLDALLTFSPKELADLREQVCAFVLDKLPSQAFDPSSIQREPPLFKLLLENFDFAAQKGEPTGAAFQGVAFGFLRADNPHLQIEIDKVRTGSKRLQRIGDIDAWEGARLVISAEVKHYTITAGQVDDLRDFANDTGRRGALGLVIAVDFEDDARSALEELGLRCLTLAEMISVVELWDPIKQRTAVSSFEYYVNHREKNSSLSQRLKEYLREVQASWESKPES